MINFPKLVSDYPELNVTFKAGELREMVKSIIKLTRQELEQIATTRETYLSRDAVSKILDVTKTTLWRWHNKGYLCHIEVGGKRKYKESDVKRILKA